MPENQPYISNVYNALVDNIKGFNVSKDDFYKKIQDDSYKKNVYTALKDNIQGFGLSENDFYSKLGKKEATKELPKDIKQGKALDISSFVQVSPKDLEEEKKAKEQSYQDIIKPEKGIPVSESTKTKFTKEEKPTGVPEVRIYDRQKAVRNTAEKVAKSKYGQPTESQIQSEVKNTEDAIKSGKLSRHTDADGNVEYAQNANLLQGFVNSVDKGIINTGYGLSKLIKSVIGQDTSGMDEEQTTRLKTAELDPVGEFLNFFNPLTTEERRQFNPLAKDEHQRLEDALKERGGLDVSYESTPASIGSIGGDILTFAALPEGKAAKLASTAALSYSKNYGEKSNQLFNELKSQGYSDEDASNKSKVDALTQAIPQTAFDTYLFGRTPVKAPTQSALNLLQATGHIAKNTAKFSALGGGQQALEEGIKGLQGYKTEGWEGRVYDAMVNGAAMTAVMESIPYVASLPKVAASAIYDYANKDIVKPIIQQALEKLPESISEPFKEGMKKYEDSTKDIKNVIPEDKMHVIGGLTTKIKSIDEDIQKLNEQKKTTPESLHETIDNKVADLEQQKKEANNKISQALKSDNPIDVEYDDAGNKIVEPTKVSEETKTEQPIEQPTEPKVELTDEQKEQNIISQEGKIEDDKINELIDKAKTYEPTGVKAEAVGAETAPTGEVSSGPISDAERIPKPRFYEESSPERQQQFNEWRDKQFKSYDDFRRQYESSRFSKYGETEEGFIRRKFCKGL
jgi:hypothetical protein